MEKKKEKNSITIDDLAMMVQRGFQSAEERSQSIEERMKSGFQNLQEEMQGMQEEMQGMQEGLQRVESSLGRHGKRVEYHDDEIFEIKGRLKVVEKKLAIKPR